MAPRFPSQRIERTLKIILIVLALVHVVVIGWRLTTQIGRVYQPRPVPEEVRRFAIPDGASLNDTLERLYRLDLAPRPFYVRLALLPEEDRLVLKKGVYQLPERASTYDLLRQFNEGRVLLWRLTVPEGLDKWQTAEALGASRWGDAASFMAAIEDPAPIADLDPQARDLEGYLFPETYFFPEEADPREIVAAMIRHFRERTESLRARLPATGLSLREWVALASLVEKETATSDERTVISSVFHNRLERGMLLQCDPTIIYSLKLDDRYRGKIYRSDIRYDHPYNTYVHPGLPPGPIASPSLASLEAALAPAETNYYYFVLQEGGGHYFSETLREHNRAVQRWRRYQRGD